MEDIENGMLVGAEHRDLQQKENVTQKCLGCAGYFHLRELRKTRRGWLCPRCQRRLPMQSGQS